MPKADDSEVLVFIESHRLMGQGFGLIDMHLLASVRLGGMAIWTRDRRLEAGARQLDLQWD